VWLHVHTSDCSYRAVPACRRVDPNCAAVFTSWRYIAEWRLDAATRAPAFTPINSCSLVRYDDKSVACDNLASRRNVTTTRTETVIDKPVYSFAALQAPTFSVQWEQLHPEKLAKRVRRTKRTIASSGDFSCHCSEFST